MSRLRRRFALTFGLLGLILSCHAAWAATPEASHRGRLYLVGIGPGDPELATLQAVRILKQADDVFCFAYLADQVAQHARPETIHVAPAVLMGKYQGPAVRVWPAQSPARTAQTRSEMEQFVPRVRALVAAGRTVVLADAGDPTIFCPWTWARDTFADLSPVVVAGLSSFNAANTALRPTLTCCGGAMLLSNGDELGAPDAGGRLQTTLVIFTHRHKAEELVPRLAARYPADTPIALVCEAGGPTQSTRIGTLATILEKVRGEPTPQLYLMYVGDHVAAARAP